MSMSNKNTEATFEADVKEQLHRVFPSLNAADITHQRSFTLKFGHHNVSVNGKTKNYSKGRLDVLVSIKGKPTAIFELKNPSNRINQDDVDQGISYARLTNPITPLTIISNGSETKVFNTYTGEKLNGSTIEEEQINQTINAGMKLAANKKADAISLLIGDDPEILAQIIKHISATNFSPYVGSLTDFTKPISKDFSIPRSVSKQLLEQAPDNHLLALIGEAYSGKTNVLWQTYHQTDWAKQSVYYVDASNSYGALQQLANYLSKEIRIPINKDRVRNWIINGYIAKDDYSLLIIFDNWNTNVHPDLQTEFLELLDLFRDTGNSVVIAVDITTYRKLTVQKDRLTRNLIGHESTITELKRLSDEEFENVNDLLYKSSEHFLGDGAQYHPWFLQPRSLRILAGTMKNDIVDMPAPKPGLSRAFEIPSVPGEFMFEMVKKIPISTEFKIYLKKHAELFLTEINSELSPMAQLARYRTGAVTLNKLKTAIDEPKIDVFITQGFLLKEFMDDSEILIYPVLVELISLELPQIIANKILNLYTKKDNVTDIYKEFKSLCSIVPYGDIVGSEVIKLIGKSEVTLYGDLFNELFKDSPREEAIGDGAELITRIKNASVKIKFKGGNIEKLISNLLPWSIASLLMLHPMKSEGEPNEYYYYFKNLARLGDFKGGLLFISPSGDEPFSLIYQAVPKYGDVLSSKMGIVEPIVHSMRNAIRMIPDLMIEFANVVTKEEKFHLIYRLNLASRYGNDDIVNEESPFKIVYDITYSKLQEMLDEAFLEELNIDMKKLRDQHNESKDLTKPNE